MNRFRDPPQINRQIWGILQKIVRKKRLGARGVKTPQENGSHNQLTGPIETEPTIREPAWVLPRSYAYML